MIEYGVLQFQRKATENALIIKFIHHNVVTAYCLVFIFFVILQNQTITKTKNRIT